MGSCAWGARPFSISAGTECPARSFEHALLCRGRLASSAFGTGARSMPKSQRWVAPRGSLAWGTERILRLLERDEIQKMRQLQKVQTQDPEIESEQLAPPPPDPNRFPPGMWQHVPGILPKQVEPDPRDQPPRRGERHGPYNAPGGWTPPEVEFPTPAIDPRLVPGWEERTPVYCPDPTDPFGPPRLCRWIPPPSVGPIPPGGLLEWLEVSLPHSRATRRGRRI